MAILIVVRLASRSPRCLRKHKRPQRRVRRKADSAYADAALLLLAVAIELFVGFNSSSPPRRGILIGSSSPEQDPERDGMAPPRPAKNCPANSPTLTRPATNTPSQSTGTGGGFRVALTWKRTIGRAPHALRGGCARSGSELKPERRGDDAQDRAESAELKTSARGDRDRGDRDERGAGLIDTKLLQVFLLGNGPGLAWDPTAS